MREFVITTDNNADLPDSYYTEHQVGCVSLTYTLEGETYDNKTALPVHEFYEKMRNGSMPTTAQVNPESARALMEPYLKEGKDILHLAFSSGLSGSYNSARIAGEELKEEYPEAKIVVIDSLCASLGQGLFVHKAVQMKEQGKTMDEIIAWLDEHKLNFSHVFTVDDLNHLYRGGRVSKATAVFGTMINIKPLLHVDNEGHLIAVGKTRGRKKSLHCLVDMMEERIGSYRDKNDIFFISHGDCPEEAEYVAKLVRERFGIQDCLINAVGATIGAHSGPGTMALFFLGDKR
ncbi:MAG: DegV family protein [Lachnospiraceae bacterium]|nr:DegV family protein [Lachnospiraceae bacterium]MDD3615264.1 DegV family protein [Lachnospiraceae bacterium]